MYRFVVVVVLGGTSYEWSASFKVNSGIEGLGVGTGEGVGVWAKADPTIIRTKRHTTRTDDKLLLVLPILNYRIILR